ncbi:MAG: DUF29 domain-containing protein [Cyanophyceae cyanobacterium]
MDTAKLYETDFYQWTQETSRAIQERDIEHLDWENLAEEIEALGRAEKRAVNSFTTQLLIHLLYLQFWTWRRDYYIKGWESDIDTFRLQLIDLLESKVLYNYFTTELNANYRKAIRLAAGKYQKERLVGPNFPEQCPYTVEQLLALEYFPRLEN